VDKSDKHDDAKVALAARLYQDGYGSLVDFLRKKGLFAVKISRLDPMWHDSSTTAERCNSDAQGSSHCTRAKNEMGQ
jgi:hypothetical protein